jgi:hypothetical protein
MAQAAAGGAKVRQQRLVEHGEAHRLERAVRFVLGAIGPLVISFGWKLPFVEEASLLPVNYSYVTAIFYCLFAALAPPQLSSLAIVGGGALVGILLGLALAVACFCVAVTAGKAWALLCFGIGILVASPLKTGRTQGLTFLICTCFVYSAAIVFIFVIPFADPGMNLELTQDELVSSFVELNKHAEWKNLLPDWMWNATVALVLDLLNQCGPNDGSNATLAADCRRQLAVPEGPLRGIELDVSVAAGLTNFRLVPSVHIVPIIWNTGPLAVIKPLIMLFLIAVGFYAVSLLIPLPRVRTAYDVTRSDLVRLIAGPLHTALDAVEEAVTTPEARVEAILKVDAATKVITDHMTPLLVSARMSAFELGWPAMGVPLLRLMPALVLAVRECAQSASTLARGALQADEEQLQLTKGTLQSARDVMQAAANLLTAMPYSAEDLTGVPHGTRVALEKALFELKCLSENIRENENGWLLRHGLIHNSMDLATTALQLCDLRACSKGSFRGFARSTGMMVAGFLVPSLVPFYRIVQPVLMCIKGQRLGGGFDWHDIRIQLGLTIGVVLLVFPSLYFEGWAEFGITDMEKQIHLRGHFSYWAVLGFIVSYTPTLEGAVLRSTMRALGTFGAALAAWAGVAICGPTNHTALIIWLLVSYALAVAVGANPRNPLYGFNLSWGYAAQVFTYSQTIIVVEAAVGIGEDESLALSRLLAQLVGISTALLMSVCVWVRTRTAAKTRIAHAFTLLALMVKQLSANALDAKSASSFDAPRQLLAAVEEKLDEAQAALDDSKAEVTRQGSQWILGPGGVGMEEARAIVGDCYRVLSLIQDGDVRPSDAVIAAVEEAFGQAAETLRTGTVETKAYLGVEETEVSEVTWLLARAANCARVAGPCAFFSKSVQDEALGFSVSSV